jgi:hypothetical protein
MSEISTADKIPGIVTLASILMFLAGDEHLVLAIEEFTNEAWPNMKIGSINKLRELSFTDSYPKRRFNNGSLNSMEA